MARLHSSRAASSRYNGTSFSLVLEQFSALTVRTSNRIMSEPANLPPRPRVLSGMRPTGKLHLGNYMGALANWVKLQDQYECYFFIADWHALTTDYADPGKLQSKTLDVALDW